jgi:hypothetical protein
VLDKGIEVDLQSWFRQGDDCIWDSVVTFYYRGQFGAPAAHGDSLGAPRTSPEVDPAISPATSWRIADGARWQYGKLTGDYNGVHQWNWYARRLGFAAAFPHSQWVAAQCLGRMAKAESLPLQLDLWLKGPVYFGRDVIHHQSRSDAGRDFALWIDGEQRPALVGSLSSPPARETPSP